MAPAVGIRAPPALALVADILTKVFGPLPNI